MAKSGPPSYRRLSMHAILEMERLGINPIEMMFHVYNTALKKGYLGVAGKAAADLASFRYPTLSAIAIKDMSEDEADESPMTTKEAMEILASDPFRPTNETIVDQIDSTISIPKLSSGK